MYFIGFFPLFSLLLGLLAFALPVYMIISKSKYIVFSVFSFCSCAISLYLVIYYTNHLVSINDFTAMLDIYYFLNFTASFMLLITIILNIFGLVVIHKLNNKGK